jgi:CheY-like chemotaxis protein
MVNQTLFRSILEKMGHTIDVAADGREAVSMTEKGQYDLIFMDIQMPNMNGFEATEEIRKSNTEVPIIAVTANAIKEEVERSRAIGMNDFLTKPFKKADLVPVLMKWGSGGRSETASHEISGEPSDDATLLIFDFDAAVETFMGDRDVVKNLLVSFIPRVEGDIRKMEESLNQGHFDSLRQTAHSIKGGSWNLEIKDLGNQAAELEKAARAQSSEAAASALEEVKRAFASLRDYLEENGFLT